MRNVWTTPFGSLAIRSLRNADPWLCVPPLRMVCLCRGYTNVTLPGQTATKDELSSGGNYSPSETADRLTKDGGWPAGPYCSKSNLGCLSLVVKSGIRNF